MMTFRKITPLMLILFCALVLTACSGKRSVVLDSPTCGSHCWRNITLGETDANQTVQLLQLMADVDPQSISHFRRWQGNTEMVAASFLGTKESWMEITFLEGKAAVIYFYFQEDAPLGAIIRKFGEPKYIWPRATEGDPVYLSDIYFLLPGKRDLFVS